MDELYAIHFSGDHLAHYGRKGMKWGQNIFQTEYEGKGNSVNTNETTAPKKPSVLQNVNSFRISTFPEAIQKKVLDHQKKADEATLLLDSLAANLSQMDADEKAKVYASSKVQGLISTIIDEINSCYDLLIPASKKGKAEGDNKITEQDRLMENIAIDRWVRKIFGDDVVDGDSQDKPDFKAASISGSDDEKKKRHTVDSEPKLTHTYIAQNSSPIRGDSYVIHFSGEAEDEYLAHVGVKRRSGRWPWGSGERPYQGESQAFRDRASAGKISKYEKKRLKEENKAQVERVKAAAAYAKAERKAAERTTKATEAADKQAEKDFERQQKRVEAEEKLKDKQNKDEVKAINQLSGKILTPAQQAQLALANMDSMSNQDLKNMLDRIDYQQKLSAIASAEKTKGQKIMSNLGNAVVDVAVKQLIPGAGKVLVEYGQSKLRDALDLPESSKKNDNQNNQNKQNKQNK